MQPRGSGVRFKMLWRGRRIIGCVHVYHRQVLLEVLFTKLHVTFYFLRYFSTSSRTLSDCMGVRDLTFRVFLLVGPLRRFFRTQARIS